MGSVIIFIPDVVKKKGFRILEQHTQEQKQSVKEEDIKGGTDEVQDAKRETSELYPYLGW